MTTTTTMNADEAAKVFGIAGEFPGDEELIQELLWCAAACQEQSKPPLARLVSLLGSLPLKGRYAVARQYFAASPHRDAILRELFDYCFQEGSDEDEGDNPAVTRSESEDDDDLEDFVLIGNPLTRVKSTTGSNDDDNTTKQASQQQRLPLNLNRFHIFQVVIVLMAVSGPAGAEMSRRYLNDSSSTKYRAKILVQCIECFARDVFTDDELMEQYLISPRSVQDKIVEACQAVKKKKRKRKNFLRLVYELDTKRHPDLLYSLESDYLAGFGNLDALVDDKTRYPPFPFKHWGSHGDVYLALIRRKMEQCRPNRLQMGTVWQDLTGQRIDTKSMQSRHAMELFKIWQDFQPAKVDYAVTREVREYLWKVAAKGEDIVAAFQKEVKPVYFTPSFLEKLSKKERLKLVTKCITKEKDWPKFSNVMSTLVPRHLLPYKATFQNAIVEDVWAIIAGKSVLLQDQFLQYFCHIDLFNYAWPGHEQTEILKAWTEMHLRCTPALLNESQRGQFTGASCSGKQQQEVELWRKWWTSYGKFVDTDQPTAKIRRDPARLDVYAQQRKLTLELIMEGSEQVRRHLVASEWLGRVMGILETIPYKEFAKSDVEAARGLVEEGIKTITATVLPALDDGIQFDPTSSTYVTMMSINQVCGIVQRLANSGSFSGWGNSLLVLQSTSSFILELYDRASKVLSGARFVVANQSGHRSFAFFDYRLHGIVVDKCCALAEAVLGLVKAREDDESQEEGLSPDLAFRVWEIVRTKALQSTDLALYLRNCASCLTKKLKTDEEQSIVELSRSNIMAKYKGTPHRWKEEASKVALLLMTLGLLEKVVEDDEVPKKVREALLVDYGGFANEKARQSLKDATYVADGEERAEGITAWLSEACKTGSLDYIEEALVFAESRIKNEAGPNRKIALTWFQNNFAHMVVVKSLKADSDTVKKFCSIILAIQKNDFGRLDCVGRRVCFPTLPKHIIDEVLAFDPSQPLLEARQLWISCAIRIHWELQLATGGTQNLADYSWPLAWTGIDNEYEYDELEDGDAQDYELKSASWVPEQCFNDLYPTSAAKALSTLRTRMQLDEIVRAFDATNTFSPAQCVDIFAKALNEVWSADLPVTPLLLEGHFPSEEEEDTADALRVRIESLFCLCGPTWQESTLLVSIFDNIFKGIEEAPPSHFSQASKFLRTLFFIHGDGVVEVPRLVDACDTLFRHAAKNNDTETVQTWRVRWERVYLAKAGIGRVWDKPVSDRMKQFVHRHGEGCEPEAWRDLMSETGKVRAACSMVRELLALSPSAILLDEVRGVLFQRRQDVLLRSVKANHDRDLDGVFNNDENEWSTVDEVLFRTISEDTLSEEKLLGCAAYVTRRYAKFALEEAKSNRCDLQGRIEAIHYFMGCPSTQPADVLAALQGDLEDAVRESLINRVFSLDSPWHILGYLLSQKAIEKNDQRITSSLLGYVSRHVQIDKVVLVLGHLLKKSRRKKLSFQLHKAAIRMLFDAETDVAMELLKTEWDHDLHESVRALIVEICVRKVVSGKVDGWEASVLSRVASTRSESIGEDLKFCLFAPTWESISGLEIGRLNIKYPEDVLADDMLDLFRRKGVAAVSTTSFAVARKFRSILEELESSSDGTLQFLAKIKKLSLSDVFGGSDDQGALDDMQRMIDYTVDFADHKTQVGMRLVSEMFAKAVFLETQKNMALRYVKDKKEASAVCGEIEAVTKLRACVGTHLDAALDMPIRKHIQRAVHLDVLKTMLNTLKDCERQSGLTQHGLKVARILFADSFEKELAILKKDQSNLSAFLSLV